MAANSEATVHVGTYRKAGGQGLYPLRVTARGELAVGDPYPGAADASFAVRSGPSGLSYLVDEERGTLGAWRHEASGWVQVGETQTQGEQPCYLALDEDRRRLAVAN